MCAAPRGALLYPRRSREELGGRFLGPMADLDPKGEGDQSMPGKQQSCPGVRVRGAAGPAEYGESWIASSPISRRCKPPSTGKTSEPVPRPATVFRFCRRNLRSAERCPVRAFKEMSGPPTFRSTRTTRTNAGSPTGRESYGDGGLVVAAGVTTCQGGRESRLQGEAAPSNSVLDRSRREQRFGRRRPLGRPPYLDAKARGESSMVGKRGTL
jgi:hypothetical protein